MIPAGLCEPQGQCETVHTHPRFRLPQRGGRGELAAPYLAMMNDQFNRISAEINAEMRRRSPDFGHGRRG